MTKQLVELDTNLSGLKQQQNLSITVEKILQQSKKMPNQKVISDQKSSINAH